MKTLGINLAHNEKGRPLRDGGACLVADGRVVVAIAEERLSRIKHDGGFDRSIHYCLETAGLDLDDLDAVVVSSCVDLLRDDVESWGLDLSRIPPDKVHYIPSHHLSHAYSTFMVSPFEEALIVVMDAGGNILEGSSGRNRKWWRHEREQNSYYVGRGRKVDLIGRDFGAPFSVGFGEAYRAFTYFLGWHSYVYSANTMALSAYGSSDRFENVELYEFRDGKLLSLMRCDPKDPIGMIQRFARDARVDFGPPRKPGAPIEETHKDLAFLIQDRFEQALISKVTSLSQSTGLRKLCMAGGVALNCVANSKLLESTPIEELFVVPAAGDSGQCLGNAFYGSYSLVGESDRIDVFSPYLGRCYHLDDEVISRWLNSNPGWELVRTNDWISKTAELISQGYIVGWFSGRSEFGPRALGSRSILADPRYRTIEERVARIKERQDFRPFSPSVLLDYADDYYYMPADSSPYMLLVAHIRPYRKRLVPGVLHVDGTSRLQTVTAGDNPVYHKLLTEYMRITGIPMLLNTSFNRRGEPIVESPEDAYRAFGNTDLDVLAIEGYVLKKKEAETNLVEVWAEANEMTKSTSRLKARYYDLTSLALEELMDLLESDFPEYKLVPRDHLGLYHEYVELLRSGRKVTTVRYRGREAISVPSRYVLPVEDVGPGGANEKNPEPAGAVKVTGFSVKPFGWLDDADGKRDGFADARELKEALQDIYGPIHPNQYVSVFTIHPM